MQHASAHYRAVLTHCCQCFLNRSFRICGRNTEWINFWSYAVVVVIPFGFLSVSVILSLSYTKIVIHFTLDCGWHNFFGCEVCNVQTLLWDFNSGSKSCIHVSWIANIRFKKIFLHWTVLNVLVQFQDIFVFACLPKHVVPNIQPLFSRTNV